MYVILVKAAAPKINTSLMARNVQITSCFVGDDHC